MAPRSTFKQAKQQLVGSGEETGHLGTREPPRPGWSASTGSSAILTDDGPPKLKVFQPTGDRLATGRDHPLQLGLEHLSTRERNEQFVREVIREDAQ
jgi:hypothetical protein